MKPFINITCTLLEARPGVDFFIVRIPENTHQKRIMCSDTFNVVVNYA